MFPYNPYLTRINVTAMEQVVLGAITMHPQGATQDDVLGILTPKYPQSSVTARFSSLIDKGLVLDTGERRKSARGRAQRVLRASDYFA